MRSIAVAAPAIKKKSDFCSFIFFLDGHCHAERFVSFLRAIRGVVDNKQDSHRKDTEKF